MTCTNKKTTGDTSGFELRYIEEECWGETTDIDDDAKMQKLRLTSESLGVDRSTVVSDEIISDRQITDLIPTSFSAAGDINGEFSKDTYDDFIRSATGGEWESNDSSIWTLDNSRGNVGVNSSLQIVYSGGTIPSFFIGQELTFSGFTTAGNNKTITIKALTTTLITPTDTTGMAHEAFTASKVIRVVSKQSKGVVVKDSGKKLVFPENYRPAVDEIVGKMIRLSGFKNDASVNNMTVLVTKGNASTGEYTVSPTLPKDVAAGSTDIVTIHPELTMSNGSEDVSFYIEKEFTDIAGDNDKKILTYLGMMVDRMSINIEAEAKTTIAFSFMGRTGGSITSSFKSEPLEPTTTDVLISTARGAAIIKWDENGTDKSIDSAIIRSMSIEVSNNLRGKTAIGTLGSVDMGLGRFSTTGTFTMYLENFSLYKRYLENDSFSITFTVGDMDSSNCYMFHMPKVKIINSSVVAGGPDQDVMVEIGYQALRGEEDDFDKTLYISKT